MSLTPENLPVAQRHPQAKLSWIDMGPAPTPPEAIESPVDVALKQMQDRILDGGYNDLHASLRQQGLLPRRATTKRFDRSAEALKQARNEAVMQALPPGQNTGMAWGALPQLGPVSQQISLEDLYTSLDFVPIPGSVSLEVYEQEFFQEDHIDGTLVSRVATSVTKRGWEYLRYENSPDVASSQADIDDQAEVQALEDWFDQVNQFRTFKQIIQRFVAAAESTENAYLEVLPDSNNFDRMPAGLEIVRSSSMRWIRGHRGFIQYTAGMFRWFNPYIWNIEDRQAGQLLWEQYWRDRDVDPYSEAFAQSPWSRTINSQMPDGVWNPYCNEIISYNGLSLDSKYYGFPKTYRIGKLHALLQAALDYNVALQQNNVIGPFILQFHGELDDASREDIINYFRGLKGPQNWARIPILEAPAMATGPTGPLKTGGLEIVKITDEGKDGVFLELWKQIRQDIAMVRAFPLDLLTTENSNRATIEIAEQLFDDNVVREYHETIEHLLKRLTKYDLGFKQRYLHFKDMDVNMDGEVQKMQIGVGYRNAGILNPDEVRNDYLSKGPRPGGEQYIDLTATRWATEDEEGEEEATAEAKGNVSGKKSASVSDVEDAADTPAGQQGSDGAKSKGKKKPEGKAA